MGTGAVQDDARDLVIFALPGVQSFIEETRSTSDVSAASQIYAALAARVIRSFHERGDAVVILPDPDASGSPANSVPVPGVPNRIVLSLPAGSGADAAAAAAAAARAEWRDWLATVLGAGDVPQTLGFPRLQWVCVPPVAGGDYASQWGRAQQLLAGRQVVRDFAAVPEDEWRRRELCMLSPRWPAERKAPKGVPAHERDLKLSAVGWVKRRWRRDIAREGFPSTASIASAPYRLAVLDHLGDEAVSDAVRRLQSAVSKIPGTAPETPVPGLADVSGAGRWLAVSGGPWVYPDTWQLESLAREAGLYRPGRDAKVPAAAREQLEPVVGEGRLALRDLRDALAALPDAVPPLARYLAVAVQDLDSMGLFLSGKAASLTGERISLSESEHRRVSGELLRVAGAQRAVLCDRELLGVPVYAGGDDLLAFVPASTALDAAERCHDTVSPSLPSASTAVLFFHYHASIQQAMSEARALLKNAKKQVEGKHALAVGYLRRSGSTAVSIQPWPGREGASSAVLFRLFARGGAEQLSPRLVSDLERDAGELAALRAENEKLYVAELARLVRRHTEGGHAVAVEAVQALDWLGLHERLDGKAGVARPHVAARVGVFLRQEAR